MGTLSDNVRKEMQRKYPTLDLTYFDKYFETIAAELIKWQKQQSRLCYQRKCDKRMV